MKIKEKYVFSLEKYVSLKIALYYFKGKKSLTCKTVWLFSFLSAVFKWRPEVTEPERIRLKKIRAQACWQYFLLFILIHSAK